MTNSAWGIVWNPSKGDRETLESALGLSADEAARLRWYETDAEDGGAAAAKQAVDDGCEIVFASGGDGTVRVVAEAVAGSDAALGIIPQGTGNLLARNLGVPLSSPAAGFRFALEHEARPLDVARVEIVAGEKSGTSTFAVMAGLGIDAHLMAETKDDLKEKAGWLAYIEATGRAFAGATVVTATVTFDDEAPLELPAHTIMVGNCGSIQGGVTVFPDAKPDDGQLDVLILNADSALGWLDTLKTMVWDNAIARLWTKESPESATTTFRKARSVEIVLSEPVPFQIDGDEMGEVTHLKIDIGEGELKTRW